MATPATECRPVGERGAIDHEAVLDVALEHALVGCVDLLDRDHLDVGDDAVLGAEVEHLLGLRDAADERAGERAALQDQVERRRATDAASGGAPTSTMVPSRFSSAGKALRSCGAATVSRMRSKLPGVLRHRVGVVARSPLRRRRAAWRPARLRCRGGEQRRPARPSRAASLTPMWPRPPRPTTPTLLARADVPVAQRRVGGDAGAQQRRHRRRGRARLVIVSTKFSSTTMCWRVAAVGVGRGRPASARCRCR